MPKLLTSRNRSWWTTDLFIVPPRDNEGSCFKDVTNYGRKDAVEAFQAYEKGDKSKLADIIAQGVNMAAEDIKVEEGNMNPQQHAVIEASAKLVELMEKDPELKELARQKGMKDECLKTAEGMKQLSKLNQDALDAEYEISKAKLEGRELSAEEKAKYAKAMVMSRLAVARLAVDNGKECPEADEKLAYLAMNAKPVNGGDLKKWEKDPASRPAPPKGKIWMDTMQALAGSIMKVYKPIPESLIQISSQKGLKSLEKVAEEIVRQEGLAGKTTEELANEAEKPTLDMGKATAKAMEVLAKPAKRQEQGLPEAAPVEKTEDNPALGGAQQVKNDDQPQLVC